MAARGWWMILVLGGAGACIGLPPAAPGDTDTDASSTGASTGDSDPEASDDGSATALATSTGTTGAVDDTTGTSLGSGSSSSSSGGRPDQEVLERADFARCDDPLWCYASGDPTIPIGGGTWAQECFTATMTPPFSLVEVEAVIQGLGDEIVEVELEVFDGAAGPPGAPIGRRILDASVLSLGVNTIPVDPPLLISQQDVCIGFAAPDDRASHVLGISADPRSLVPEVSYLRMEGGGGCFIPDWTDVIELNPMPLGNWCIRGIIEPGDAL